VTDRELTKNAARRRAMIRHVEEATGNLALICAITRLARRSISAGSAAMSNSEVDGLSSRNGFSCRSERRTDRAKRCWRGDAG